MNDAAPPSEPHGENEDEDEDDFFEIRLSFAGASCPRCGIAGEPGACPHCGADVPATDESNELVRARQAALGPLAEQARELLAAFDDIETGQIPVATDQFVAAVSDVELFLRVGEMPAIGNQLSAIDFNDSKAVGRDARRVIGAHLERLRELLRACHELAAFRVAGPGAELQEIALEAGRYGARIVDVLARIVTVTAVAHARAAQGELQELLSGFPAGQRFDDLLPQLEEWAAPDIDGRIGLVMGRADRYTDDFGLLDPARVFAAFSDAEEPFAALADRASTYFAHLLPSEAAERPEFAFLVLPAVALASLDRPISAHRAARQINALLHETSAQDAPAVQTLIDRLAAAGPLIFAAAARVERALRLLGAGEQAGLVDDEALIASVMNTYQEIAESQFRTLAWLVVGLERVAAPGAPPTEADPPTLGELEQRLAACDHPLAQALVQASDSALRNAAGHSQYRWDRETQRVVDLRAGTTWTLDQLETAVDDLVGAVCGLDAGYTAFVLDSGLELEPPSWLGAGEAPHASLLLAQASFGAYGYEVREVSPDGSELWLSGFKSEDLARLFPPLAGMLATFTQAESIRVIDAETSEAIVEIDGAAMREAINAHDDVKDLAVLAPMYSGACSRGRDPVEAVLDVVAVQVAVIALNALPAISASGPPGNAGLRHLARRLAYTQQFVVARERRHKSARKLAERLGRATGSAQAAAHGDAGARVRLGAQLAGLLQWAGQRGVSWPPI